MVLQVDGGLYVSGSRERVLQYQGNKAAVLKRCIVCTVHSKAPCIVLCAVAAAVTALLQPAMPARRGMAIAQQQQNTCLMPLSLHLRLNELVQLCCILACAPRLQPGMPAGGLAGGAPAGVWHCTSTRPHHRRGELSCVTSSGESGGSTRWGAGECVSAQER